MIRGFTYGWAGPSPQALEQMAQLSEAQFNVLREAVTGPEGFDLSLGRCEALATQLKSDLKTRDVFRLLSSLRFFYDRCRDWERGARDSATALREFIQLAGLFEDLGDGVIKRLLELTVKNPTVERRQKLRWLRTGILDTAVNFASFVDVRPRISEDRREIEGLVPVVILRINTESESGEPKSHIFQLTLEGLTKLRAVVEDVEKKLKLVNTDPVFGPRMEKEVTTEEEEA